MFEKHVKMKVKSKIYLIPIKAICASPFQPRRIFDKDELDSLSRSIAHNGLLVPISVREKSEHRYELIAGERRLRACENLGLNEIPAMIEQMDEDVSAIMTFTENVQRKDLNYFEEAQGIKKIMEVTGYNQAKVCTMLDMSQSTVANKLRLLRLEDEIKEMVMKYGFGERITRALLQLSTKELQIRACNFIYNKNLTAAKAEEYIHQLVLTVTKGNKRKPIFSDYRLIFNGFDRVIEDIKKTGLTVHAKKSEEEHYMCYTIKVEKTQNNKQTLKSR